MKFVNRWKIEGTLTTLTPLRIGDGDIIEAQKRLTTTHLKADTKINTVATDKDKKPYISASAIKGSLRAWAKNVLTDDEIEIIFGSKKDTQPENLKAGKVQFSNAYFDQDSDVSGFDDLPDWSSDRLTAVSVGIAVNRKTRTASDKKLFHQEFVPEGITFKFEISGNDYEITDEDEKNFLKKIENQSNVEKEKSIENFNEHRKVNNSLLGNIGIKKLLSLFKGFANGVTVGAETGDADEGWGKLKWELKEIKCSTEESIKNWFENRNDDYWTNIQNFDELKKFSLETLTVPPSLPIQLSLSLQLLDDFLVNDPSKVKTPEEIKQNDPNNKKPNHSPLRNIDGKPILPKSSIKGAIRSQAEKILRTMAIGINENLTDEQLKEIACYPDEMKMACPPIKKIGDVASLCLACQLFGASGWKSPVSFTDFTAASFTERKREFVAIDRFTGGVSGSGKFNAEVAHRPKLTGKISIDFERLEKSHAKDWAIGLLALTFKDLLEGDIRFGFGRAKGFGEIKNVKVENHNLIELFSAFESDLEILGMFESIDLEELGNSDFGLHLQICIEQLIEKISRGVK